MERFTAAEKEVFYTAYLHAIAHSFAQNVEKYGLPLQLLRKAQMENSPPFTQSTLNVALVGELARCMTFTVPTVLHSPTSFFVASYYWPTEKQHLTRFIGFHHRGRKE